MHDETGRSTPVQDEPLHPWDPPSRSELERLVADSYEWPSTVLATMPEPMVTVEVFAYNHAPYIRECLDGILAQETSFPVEVVIGEDYSTDGTRGIVREYSEAHPERIRVITADYNVGPWGNTKRTRAAVRGKYIATCEGDDYWTDPRKLEKQVRFLEMHPEYSMCSHEVTTVFQDFRDREAGEVPFYENGLRDADFESLLETGLFSPVNSMVYRHEGIYPLPDWIYRLRQVGHWGLVLFIASRGLVRHMDENMGVKRKNPGGMTQDPVRLSHLRPRKYIDQVFLYRMLQSEVDSQGRWLLERRIRNLYLKEMLKLLKEREWTRACSAGINCGRSSVTAVWQRLVGNGVVQRTGGQAG